LLLYFVSIENIWCKFGIFLWPFVTFCVHLVHFSGFGIVHQENLATLLLLQKNLFSCTDFTHW
jgi:hypothetical protein